MRPVASRTRVTVIHNYDSITRMFVIRPCAVRIYFFAVIEGGAIVEITFDEIRMINHTSVEYEYERTNNKIDQKTNVKYLFNVH